eukprot:5650231-Prymnesium_polylepis.1
MWLVSVWGADLTFKLFRRWVWPARGCDWCRARHPRACGSSEQGGLHGVHCREPSGSIVLQGGVAMA